VRRLRAIDVPPALGALALLLVLVLGDEGWSDVGWATAALSVLVIALGLAIPVLGATRTSPVLPMLATVLATVLAFAAAVALLVDGVPVGALAAAVELAGAYYAMKDDRAPGGADPPVDLRPAPPTG
jgi:hypothetical protein